jgi:hypothetical protein
MSSKITLTILAGSKRGEVFPFDKHDTLLFGRMDDAHICLPDDQQVSRHHFILEVNPPDARLRDLGSLNGTYVNNVKYGGREKHETPEEGAKRHYPQVDLHEGDEIQVGQTVMRIGIEMSDSQPRVRCPRCGKDVTSEVGAGRSGEFVCAACRQQGEADPMQLLLELLRRAAVAELEVEIHIPNYEIKRKLGEGGMGAVYLVEHMKDKTQAALKVMLARIAVDTNKREEFQREMKATRAVQHPHVVKFIESGAAGSIFYFLLEYCDSGNLYDLMQRRGGKLSLQEAGLLFLQALDGLAFVHSQGFVHRDLKPHNILLSGSGRQRVAKIADLGLAKNFEQAGLSGLTVTGNFAGSFPYMPREQVTDFKYFKPVSDVWSIAATYYHAVTGRFPRNYRSRQDPLEWVLSGAVVPIRKRDPSIPSPIAEVIDRALADDLGQRYQNAGEMYQAFSRALQKVK